jgi:hypothetical protein
VDTAAMAREMLAECRDREQSARTVPDDGEAALVRAEVRRLAAGAGVRIRTARLDTTVVVVRLDAAVWHEDAATMRRELAPADGR